MRTLRTWAACQQKVKCPSRLLQFSLIFFSALGPSQAVSEQTRPPKQQAHPQKAGTAEQDRAMALASLAIDRGDYRKALDLLLPIQAQMSLSAPYQDLLGVAYFQL